MKLNNRGWGTLEMFLLCGGLLIALLIAIFFISKFYSNLEIDTTGKQYIDLEAKLEDAARDFVRENDLEITDELKINYDTLKSNDYIKVLKDKNGNECNGYVLVTKIENELRNHYKGYISCDKYTTRNY